MTGTAWTRRPRRPGSRDSSCSTAAWASDLLMYVSNARGARSSLFFFNDTATTEIYTLSLHDALPISPRRIPDRMQPFELGAPSFPCTEAFECTAPRKSRSEEHTSELQSPCNLVCRLLLEKKNGMRECSSLNDRYGLDAPSASTWKPRLILLDRCLGV